MSSAVYKPGERSRLKKDGAGIRGAYLKGMQEEAFDEARAASQALAEVERQGRLRRKQAKEKKDAEKKLLAANKSQKGEEEEGKVKLEEKKKTVLDDAVEKEVENKAAKPKKPETGKTATVINIQKRKSAKKEGRGGGGREKETTVNSPDDDAEVTAGAFFDSILEYDADGVGAAAAISVVLIRRLASRFAVVRALLRPPTPTE